MKRLLHSLAATTILFASLHASAAPETSLLPDKLAVGPWQVQLASAGSGKYTVIFESGFGTDLRTWRKVAPTVAQSARVFSYSRAGYGASDARPQERTLLQSSLELDQLVLAAGLRPPFILVGHSYGGLLVRAFAARHPDWVAGMVLVDPGDEKFNPALRKLDAARVDQDDARFATIVPPKFKPELAALQPVLDSGVFPVAGALPDVPVVVISSMQRVDAPEFFLETAPARAILSGLHADFAKQFRDGTHIVTERSGHSIQLDEPELVVAAVQQVIRQADAR
ncbi:alpha/beta fold hydrolase [Massilia sp. S19_KUP03_FR1]|uniref:alpha/beta fold hydrolase n=1 Tax=Massilia sp. S19_KUP03_FR1 TaxID=3025503 RepID=UPI002FCD8567